MNEPIKNWMNFFGLINNIVKNAEKGTSFFNGEKFY